MPEPVPAVLDFLLVRRSCPVRTLAAPAPSRDELARLIAAAARVPDHGKLAPWRFIVLTHPALDRLAALVEARGAALEKEPARIAKAAAQYRDSPLAVAVVTAPGETGRIPLIEQQLSAGAVCMTLLAAATAQGWGANWLTGWQVYDRIFLREGLGLADHEGVAGVIHIGTPAATPPERPRPDPAALTSWPEA